MAQTIRIKLKSYDYRLLDESVTEIVKTVKKTGCQIVGPIPLPTRIEKFTVNRSPLGNKKSMDQFEIRTHNRILDILNPSATSVDELKNLNLPSGIDIQLKLKF